MFVDRVKIEVAGGAGGHGCASFRREYRVPRGGPDGGDGGHGGSVILVADPGVQSLDAFAHTKHWKAKNGTAGTGSNCHGRSGDDMVLRVPPGTVVMDERGGYVLKDLVAENESVIVAHGGSGGKGNVRFKSSTNQAPRTFTRGEPGEHRFLILELKVIADVGLLGKPNAGKSTLLSRLTRARPEIAAYPFTTKQPNLGLVRVSEDRSFVMADIPGLIEGAHAGVGLGHEFLRHIERAGILVHLVEPDPLDGTDPFQNYNVIRGELSQYDLKLSERPEIVVITKMELPGADEILARFIQEVSPNTIGISAVTGQGLNQLVQRIVSHLDEAAAPRQASA